MILLVSGSTVSVGKLAQSHAGQLGHLLTPANRNSMAAILKTGLHWAADNGAFSGFDPVRFQRFLAKIKEVPRCIFVVCPDKVADAQATVEMFWEWMPKISFHSRQPIAFVGQDGAEDLDLPWGEFDAFFVGGSTRWKLSQAADSLCQEAKRRRKWLHVGRVNSLRRIRSCLLMQADSIDGSSASRWGGRYILKYLQWINREKQQPLMI